MVGGSRQRHFKEQGKSPLGAGAAAAQLGAEGAQTQGREPARCWARQGARESGEHSAERPRQRRAPVRGAARRGRELYSGARLVTHTCESGSSSEKTTL